MKVSRYNINMPLNVKIIRISIYYLMYKYDNMALNLNVAFLLSVSTIINQMKQLITENKENVFFGKKCPGVISDLYWREGISLIVKCVDVSSFQA